jgi:hypothetical protein
LGRNRGIAGPAGRGFADARERDPAAPPGKPIPLSGPMLKIIARPIGRGHDDLSHCWSIGFFRKVDSTFRSDAPERFRAKRAPVRVKKTR